MVKDSSATKSTIKFLCSYGGKILPRHNDGKLRYVGGYTRILSVDRWISYTELMVELGEFCGSSVTLRCQLPCGDLDTLVSITSDKELASIIEEYDTVSSSLPHPLKIRAILSPPKSLKRISPCVSTNSSGDYSVTNSIGSCVHRAASPPVRFPVKDAGKVCYYPRYVQGCLYLVPHLNLNYRQK